jgi:hypothetical protein
LIFCAPAFFRTTSNSVFSSSAAPAASPPAGTGHHDRAASGGLDAVFVLEDGFQFLGFEEGQTHDLFCKFLQISHFQVPL